MAARINLPQTQKTRDKIKTSQLINRLENHAFGNVDLTPTQVNAIKILLGKTIPDLKQTDIDIQSSNGSMSPPSVVRLVGVSADDAK